MQLVGAQIGKSDGLVGKRLAIDLVKSVNLIQ